MWLENGCKTLAHRGPDDMGVYWSDDKRVGLGHRRLSIIDLSAAGHQPMQSKDSSLCISYNGEIYNHLEIRRELEEQGRVFQSLTDTEVILAAYQQWGKNCLERLKGMFAFAIYDTRSKTLFIARDRSGEKPLFYRLTDMEIRFGSELKALTVDPSLSRRVNQAALDMYLTMGYVPGEYCMLDGIKKLPPAHALQFDCKTGEVNIWRYWQPPEHNQLMTAANENELLDELEVLLENSVRRQLVADVEVGLLLSGGVDSSLVTALAARNFEKIKTFTVGFQDYSEFDETKHAALIADYFQTDHTVLQADDVQPEIFQVLARQFDEPIIDSSMIPTFLVTQQISKYCKVALGGDGGDELFGGYHSASRMAHLQKWYGSFPLLPRRIFARAVAKILPIGARGRQYGMMLGHDANCDLPIFSEQFDLVSRHCLLKQFDDWDFIAEKIRSSRIPKTYDAVQRITRFDFANYMTEDILVKIDRASMLNSLEIRSPFLDADLIDFAYSRVPSFLKATTNNRKIILQKLAARTLPKTFDGKRKQGFGIPLAYWLRSGPWRKMFEDILMDPNSCFDRQEIVKLFNSLDAGRPVKERLFGLALFEMWRSEYDVTF